MSTFIDIITERVNKPCIECFSQLSAQFVFLKDPWSGSLFFLGIRGPVVCFA